MRREHTSTKFDWYFWSRGATRRWTSPRNRTCHFSVPVGYVRFMRITHLLVVIIGNIPFGKSSFPLAILSLEYNQSYASHRTILLTWTKMNRIMMHACWSRHSSHQTWSWVLLRGYRYYIRIRSIALRKWHKILHNRLNNITLYFHNMIYRNSVTYREQRSHSIVGSLASWTWTRTSTTILGKTSSSF